MLKKIAMVFTVALSLLAFCLPVTSSAVELVDSGGFFEVDTSGKYYIPERTINGVHFPKRYIPVNYQGYYNADDYDYFIVKQDNYYYLVLYTGATAVVDPNARKITVMNTSNGGYCDYSYIYMDDTDTEWCSSWNSSTLPRSINYNSVNEFYITSTNIYDSNNNQVFPLTPWAVAIRELKAVAVPRVLGEMKIVVLCGVGCLAFLIGLVLLFKVFQEFQIR